MLDVRMGFAQQLVLTDAHVTELLFVGTGAPLAPVRQLSRFDCDASEKGSAAVS